MAGEVALPVFVTVDRIVILPAYILPCPAEEPVTVVLETIRLGLGDADGSGVRVTVGTGVMNTVGVGDGEEDGIVEGIEVGDGLVLNDGETVILGVGVVVTMGVDTGNIVGLGEGLDSKIDIVESIPAFSFLGTITLTVSVCVPQVNR